MKKKIASERELCPVSSRRTERRFVDTLICLKGAIDSVSCLFAGMEEARAMKARDDMEAVMYHLGEAAHLLSYIAAPGRQRTSDRLLREAGFGDMEE